MSKYPNIYPPPSAFSKHNNISTMLYLISRKVLSSITHPLYLLKATTISSVSTTQTQNGGYKKLMCQLKKSIMSLRKFYPLLIKVNANEMEFYNKFFKIEIEKN